MKICTKCKVEKEFSEFCKDKSRKDGYFIWCNTCKKIHRKDNPITYIKYSKQYHLDNKDHLNKKSKQYKKNNKEAIVEYSKKYNKQYRLKNKHNINKRINLYNKNRRKTDPLFKLKGNIRSLINISIRKKGYTKKSKTHEILGCSYEEFKIHLESQFTEGMTWENHGEWELDHIYPVSLATDEQHLIKLNHYTNFQPLWWEDNNSKSNKIN